MQDIKVKLEETKKIGAAMRDFENREAKLAEEVHKLGEKIEYFERGEAEVEAEAKAEAKAAEAYEDMLTKGYEILTGKKERL